MTKVMKNFKHTPGPWKFTAFTPNEIYGQSYYIETDSEENKWLAYTVANKVATISEEEAEANARLIAAAPLLLQSAIWHIDSVKLNNRDFYYKHGFNISSILNKAIEIIAKATNQKEVSNG